MVLEAPLCHRVPFSWMARARPAEGEWLVLHPTVARQARPAGAQVWLLSGEWSPSRGRDRTDPSSHWRAVGFPTGLDVSAPKQHHSCSKGGLLSPIPRLPSLR